MLKTFWLRGRVKLYNSSFQEICVVTTSPIAYFYTVGLEQDIHQTTFKDDRQKALINLLFTYGWAIEQIKNFLSQEDITHQQFNILRILRGAAPKPLSTLQIRERMLDKASDTSRIVDRLILKELVQKSTCSKDKRLVDVVITEKGKSLLHKLDAQTESMHQMMNNLSEAEAAQLNHLLDKLRGGKTSDVTPQTCNNVNA